MAREGYQWLKCMERPRGYGYHYGIGGPPGRIVGGPAGGWPYKYTYDGREAFPTGYGHIERPDYHNRAKVLLEAAEQILGVAEAGGSEALHQWYGPRPEEHAAQDGVKALQKWYGPRPVKYTDEQYLAARIEAARRVTDPQRTVRLFDLARIESWGQVQGNFLERVRQRPLQSPALGLNDGCVWTWWPVRYRGWAAWQFVWDVRVGLGKIDADTAAWGGRGMESGASPGCFPTWDTVGDWSTKAVEAESWLDIPLQDTLVHVEGVRLEPDSMTLKPGETREIKPVFSPDNATCTDGTWNVTSESTWAHACWVQPHMTDKIDPAVKRPGYSTEGKIMVHGASPWPHDTAIITFTSTDGRHSATCKVRVSKQ
jgi:hypothetical protein